MAPPFKLFRIISWPIVIFVGLALFLQIGHWAVGSLRLYLGFNLRQTSGLQDIFLYVGTVVYWGIFVVCAQAALRDVTTRTAALFVALFSVGSSLFILSNSSEASFARYWDEISGTETIVAVPKFIEPLSNLEKVVALGILPLLSVFVFYVAKTTPPHVLWLTSKRDPSLENAYREVVRAKEAYDDFARKT